MIAAPSNPRISVESSATQVLPETDAQAPSAIPVDKKEETVDDDWALDPENPRNWTLRKKWLVVIIVSYYTLIPPLASSMMAPSLPEIATMYDIHSSSIVALTLSVFLISFAIGPLFLAPLSEMYGRTWVLHIGNILSVIFNLGCAFSPTTGVLIGMRFLTGFAGSAPIACGGGSIGDLFSERDRASAMSIYTLGPLMGPALGPIAGGFLVQSVGVKYVFIVIAGVSALGSFFAIPLLQETYAPVIRLRRALRQGDVEGAKRHMVHSSGWDFIWVNLTRPVMLLTRSLICFMLSLYMALCIALGIYYLMFTTFADFFHETYGFGPGVGGLVYLGLGGGFIASTLFGANWADTIYQHATDKNNGVGKPEMRIPALFVGSLIVPIGLLWYGWSAQAKLHWMMPIVGAGIYGFVSRSISLPISLYLVDAFTYAASALAAASVFRSLFGFAFPLFASQMFDALGMGPGNSLLAGMSIVLGIPFPIWIYYYGEAMRKRSSLSR
ncbi:major facilitator superfamily domain-containing protein [Mycena floridula]|nr:major facilitator superfamily domain-containing protein [Mycena floridula]